MNIIWKLLNRTTLTKPYCTYECMWKVCIPECVHRPVSVRLCWTVFFSLSACLCGGPAAPSGVCTLNGWAECWPLLSIKGSIDWKHESVSAASHPWTADNGPGHGGYSREQSTTTGGKCCAAGGTCLNSDPTRSDPLLCSWPIMCKWPRFALKLFKLIMYTALHFMCFLSAWTVSVCLRSGLGEQQGVRIGSESCGN